MNKPTAEQHVIAIMIGFCLIVLVALTIRDWPLLMAMDATSLVANLFLISILGILDILLLIVHYLKMTRGK